jgi:regulator of sirC expression with transglutaminase-like and TPR domain
MTSAVTMNLTIPDGDSQEIAALTREMMRSIEQNTEAASVRLPQGIGLPGAKGDTVLIGQLLLTFLTSGAAVALIDVFKPYFARHPKLEIELSTAGGEVLKLKAEDIAPKSLPETVSRLRGAAFENT